MTVGREEVLLLDALVNQHNVPHHVSYAILASLILIIVAFIVRMSIKLIPTGIQNIMETVIESFLKIVDESVGHKWGQTVFPLVGTLFMFILLCNLMGLVPGFVSPTSNINTNAAMAIPVFLATHYYGLRIHGIKYIYHFLGPIRSIFTLPLMVLMFIIEFIGHLVRPITLSVRLFGNMIAKHILLGILAMLTPWILPTVVLALGTLVGVIQAFVFTLLTTLYLAGAVEEAH